MSLGIQPPFSVIHKETGEIRTVYGMNGMRFMFWDEAEGNWVFDGIENYRPFGGCSC